MVILTSEAIATVNMAERVIKKENHAVPIKNPDTIKMDPNQPGPLNRGNEDALRAARAFHQGVTGGNRGSRGQGHQGQPAGRGQVPVAHMNQVRNPLQPAARPNPPVARANPVVNRPGQMNAQRPVQAPAQIPDRVYFGASPTRHAASRDPAYRHHQADATTKPKLDLEAIKEKAPALLSSRWASEDAKELGAQVRNDKPAAATAIAPVAARIVAPVAARIVAPVAARVVAPVVTRAVAPVVARAVAPVVARVTAPVVAPSVVPPVVTPIPTLAANQNGQPIRTTPAPLVVLLVLIHQQLLLPKWM
ncbi:hypothetical protein BT63DRAFT_22149 [Microthyrium microscopicum]|uniref:Uncharacterized protein n=1 Tax=Microthyrium microscopicum TaxID=703497 RepID=A0A6A6UV65_9PEZI|nr:hypothetical protein BT63DRAFT_22149 [Microthyrium microscopicum]